MALPRGSFRDKEIVSFEGVVQPVFKKAVLTIERIKDNKLKKIAIYQMSPVIVLAVLGLGNSQPGAMALITLRFKKMQIIIL